MAYYALYITDTGDLSHLQNGDKVPLRPERFADLLENQRR